jgi:hypothetical protein
VSFAYVWVPELLYGIHISTDQQVMKDIQNGQEKIVELMQVKEPDLDEMKDITRHPQTGYDQQYIGSALRALHHYLQEADPNQVWGGLQATLTPDGNILWLYFSCYGP